MIVLPGQLGDISIYGQESNPTTRGFAIMNLALRGIEADREMPSGELRFPNGTSVTSTFALRPSNFAPASPGQLFYSTQKFNHN